MHFSHIMFRKFVSTKVFIIHVFIQQVNANSDFMNIEHMKKQTRDWQLWQRRQRNVNKERRNQHYGADGELVNRMTNRGEKHFTNDQKEDRECIWMEWRQDHFSSDIMWAFQIQRNRFVRQERGSILVGEVSRLTYLLKISIKSVCDLRADRVPHRVNSNCVNLSLID